MLSALPTLVWLFWRRHRWFLVPVLVYMLVIGALFRCLHTVSRETALFVSLPLFFAANSLFAVFSYGNAMESKNSPLPSWTFTLPMHTRHLVLFQMVAGCLTLSLFWLLIACFLQPAYPDIAWLRPVLVVSAVAMWGQAVLWPPFAVVGIRFMLFCGVMAFWPLLAALAAIYAPIDPLYEIAFYIFLVVSLPVAYRIAVAGVSQARRGETKEWAWIARLVAWARLLLPRRHGPFLSAARAQLWIEWRRKGLVVPLFGTFFTLLLVSGLPAFESFVEECVTSRLFPVLAELVGRTNSTFVIVGILLLLPPFFSSLISDLGRMEGSSHAISPFIATRPVADAAFIKAKLQMTGLSVALSWGIFLSVLLTGTLLLGRWPRLARGWQALLGNYSFWEQAALLVLGLGGLILLTWKQMIDLLFIGFAGRKWVVFSTTFGVFVVMSSAALLGVWFRNHSEHASVFLTFLPYIVGSMVCLKLVGGLWLLSLIYRRGLVSRPGSWMALWVCFVLLLFVLIHYFLPLSGAALAYLAAGIVLFVPISRMAAMPLALDWNRHR